MENLGVGVDDRCWEDAPARRMVCRFPVKTMDLEWRRQKLSSRLLPDGEQRGPWETSSVKALSLLLVLKGKKVVVD